METVKKINTKNYSADAKSSSDFWQELIKPDEKLLIRFMLVDLLISSGFQFIVTSFCEGEKEIIVYSNGNNLGFFN